MKQRVSLVLSGGGARGIAHIGVIEELEKYGFEIASVAGTSMGAVVGGVYATGKMEEFKNWLYTIDKIKLFNLIDFTFSTQGIVKGDKLLQKMKDFIPDINIEDLGIPYAAVAADIINKKEVIFRTGSVYDAIRASIAIPGIFTPVKTPNGLLVDGGIVNNIPITQVKRVPNDILIAVNVNADIPFLKPTIPTIEPENKLSSYHKRLKEFYGKLQRVNPTAHEERHGYFDLINKTIGLMSYHLTQMSLQNNYPDILIEVSNDSCGAFDFYKAQEMVEIGRVAAIKSLEDYEGLKDARLKA